MVSEEKEAEEEVNSEVEAKEAEVAEEATTEMESMPKDLLLLENKLSLSEAVAEEEGIEAAETAEEEAEEMKDQDVVTEVVKDHKKLLQLPVLNEKTHTPHSRLT